MTAETPRTDAAILSVDIPSLHGGKVNVVYARFARTLERENRALRSALELYVKWCDAENDHNLATFYQRMEMCSAAESAARAALGGKHD